MVGMRTPSSPLVSGGRRQSTSNTGPRGDSNDSFDYQICQGFRTDWLRPLGRAHHLAGCSSTTSNSIASAAPTSYVGPAGNCAGKSPCFADLQSAIDAAQGIPRSPCSPAAYAVATPSAPGTPAINVTKSLTIAGEGSPSGPGCVSGCPTFELGDGTSLGLQIAANGVKLSNLAINQKSVPGSDYAAGLVYVPANGTGLYSRQR